MWMNPKRLSLKTKSTIPQPKGRIGRLISSGLEPRIPESGLGDSGTDLGSKSGQMEPVMKNSGKTTGHTVMGGLFI